MEQTPRYQNCAAILEGISTSMPMHWVLAHLDDIAKLAPAWWLKHGIREQSGTNRAKEPHAIETLLGHARRQLPKMKTASLTLPLSHPGVRGQIDESVCEEGKGNGGRGGPSAILKNNPRKIANCLHVALRELMTGHRQDSSGLNGTSCTAWSLPPNTSFAGVSMSQFYAGVRQEHIARLAGFPSRVSVKVLTPQETEFLLTKQKHKVRNFD
eukprot:COSAG04_NODE_1578_length_6256_cov_4.952899_2_plen_212_part_00